jgi:hypothetical protein
MDDVFGRYLLVDLSSGEFMDYEVPEGWLKKHLGRRGAGARIL